MHALHACLRACVPACLHACMHAPVRRRYCKLADPTITHEEVEVSESELGYIIGFKGQTIKSIQGDTNTKIYTPGKGRKNTNVVVVGAAANVARAVKQIQRNIEKNTY
jgi:hypothetical protein